MKIRVLLLAFILQISVIVYSQASVVYEDNTADDNWVSDIVEDRDGNFVYVGGYNYLDADQWVGYITKVSPNGERLMEYVVTNIDRLSVFESINITDKGNFMVTGREASSDDSGITIMEFDNNLKLLWSKYHKISDCFSSVSRHRVIATGDGNYAGIFVDHIIGNLTFRNFIFKFTSDGELLQLKEDVVSSDRLLSGPSDILSLDNGESFVVVGPWLFLILDEDLEIIETVAQNYNPTDLDNFFRETVSCKKLSDGRMFCCSANLVEYGNRDKYGLMFIELGENYERGDKFVAINSKSILNTPDATTYKSHASEMRAIDFVTEDNIIIGGTLNCDARMPYTVPTILCVASLTPDRQINWEQYYDDGSSHHIISMCATRDGGAMVVTIRCNGDYEYGDEVKTVSMIKFGKTTGVDDMDSESQSTIYPNPASGSVSIKSDCKDMQRAYFYDSTGRLGKTIDVLPNEQSLDISDLSKGIYLVRLVSEKGVIEVHKLVVK